MSSIAEELPEFVPEDGATEPVIQGKIEDVRQVPRITVQAFCESDSVARTIEMASEDRRMAKAHIKVHAGGITAAIELYETAPTPNLIITETKLTGEELLTELERLANVCDPDTKVIVIGHLNDVQLYRTLVSRGVSEYLVSPVSMADTMSAIGNIFIDPESGPLGRMVAFIAAKGGAGSSTICHNSAWGVSTRYSSEVVLIDTDLAFGTANINFDQDPPQGVAEAVFAPDRIDDALLDRLLEKCADHLNLLAAPSTLERTYDLDAKAFNGLLDLCVNGAPNVIVDLPHQWSGWTRQILSMADEVVITACPDLANLRNAKNLIEHLAETRPNDRLPILVMNQVGVQGRPEISVPDFCAPLEIEPAVVIPFDPQLFGNAANNGQMIAEADPSNPITESLEQLSQIITGKSEIRTQKKSTLAPFLARFRK